MSKLNKLHSNITALSESRKANAQKNVDDALSTIFAEIPSLEEIVVRGSTPSFNDGDPCTHSQDVRIGSYDPQDMFLDEDEDEDDAEEDVDNEDAYEKAHDIVQALEEDFKILFDTNFELTISRSKSPSNLGFRIHHNDYDCGY